MIRLLTGDRLPAEIWQGPGCRHRLPATLAALGVRRPLVIASARAWAAADLAATLDAATIIFTGPEGATEAAIAAAAAQARAERIDGVVSVGGGTTHDMGKAVALMAPSAKDIGAFLFGAPPVTDFQPLPVLAIPTTFSAAEMVAGGAVVLAAGGKAIFGHPRIQPRAVFLDGELAATTARPILAASGLNAVHHCLESLYSLGHQAFSDAWACFALERLLRLLPALSPAAPPPPVDTLQALLEASTMSGLAYGISGLGVGHAVCHSLAGRWAISHGDANAVILPHSLAFNAHAAAGQIALATRAAGGDLAEALTALRATLGVVSTLREAGIAPDVDLVAADVLADPITATNPRPVDRAAVLGILEAAW
jgi:alcohol dehydrogenase class IV